ncbi:S1-C subfamily serine protease [Paenibacillus baekrokdamisoli]|uniref:stalk domain-containing protein n=1 Tax=Paenibacillus baekrokdamisoli TaxID=1712516 RepID=UPI000F788233|nr:stalk domain-containing protein [Paenibacillus baekrokdamisoli]MBB3072222.1 S1-C subfamily serine protease [Paenibacillus baekrokdamisoli]
MKLQKRFNMKQKLLLSVLAAGLVFAPLQGLTGNTAAAAAQSSTTAIQTAKIQVFIDGKKLSLAPAPVTIKGITVVPMRSIFTALQATLIWEPSTKTILATKGSTTITLQLGSTKAYKNGKAVTLTAPPLQMNGSTMVPLRFVAEALGAEVQMDNATQVIRITSAEALYKQLLEAAAKAKEYADKLAAATVLTTKQIIDKNDSKVVMITTNAGQGSGVVIGTNQILTNLHVMQDATSGSITLLNGKTIEIQGLVGYDEDTDLAVIQTKAPVNVAPVSIGFRASKGDHVVAIGSPLGLQNTASEGIISNIVNDYQETYQISVPIDHGSSGGGLFNDHGELIGITSSGVDATNANLNFAVSVLNIHMLLFQIEDEPLDKIAFLPSQLPDTLVGASDDQIRELLEKQFADIQTSQGTTKLKHFEVKRDSEGWLVISAVIDPAFYMVYGNSSNDDLRYWAINTGYEFTKLLPKDTIQLTVYYDQTFSYKPRGFTADEVTANADGTYRVRFPVIEMQGKEKMIVKVRT